MGEYLFLNALALAGVLFAVVQDVRTREIANWLTFSLIAFILAYRAIYSIYSADFMFFLYGLFGVLLFVGLGYLFYYARVFAGGDAKLLFGIGGVLPYSSWIDYIYYGFGFILLLFTAGVIYTLIYSAFLAGKNYFSFRKDFIKQVHSKKYYFVVSLIGGILIYSFSISNVLSLILALIVFLFPLLFAYVRAIESSCMIKLVSPAELTEGDWLEKDISVKGKTIKKNFAGLTFNEILLLRKAGKKVLIKTGVPFAPAFLIALAVFIFLKMFI